MKSLEDLKELLERIDHRGYPAYKDIRGRYQFGGYVLSINHVQGDPFASPSKVSVEVQGKVSGFPKSLYINSCRRIALQDELLRQFGHQAEKAAFKAKGSGKSGLISVSRCSQEILERSACEINPSSGDILLRMEVGLPANGRTINGREAVKIFFELIPVCVQKSLYYRPLDKRRLEKIAELADDQDYIRHILTERNLCAFVADGAVLPRESGISQKPMRGAVTFKAPESLAVTMNLPYGGNIRGMGIPKGVTLIVGGGYHGKSTLLEALERGVYNHIMDDGREYVITNDTAVKIRAEDGRSIRGIDISMFINGLPNGKNTEHFETDDASGSTSQAANVIEAMEAGSRVFLIDEDTSATNFMIRDELMQSVVGRESEPITPYIDRLRELYENYGISSIIVAGSSGSYFHKADHIIQMRQYIPEEITNFAKVKAAEYPLKMDKAPSCREPSFDRRPKGVRERPGERTKIKVLGKDSIQLNRDNIDLRYVEQLVDSEQLTALGYLLNYAQKHLMDGQRSMVQIVDELTDILNKNGLDKICESSYLPSGLAMPRKQEIFACFNRYRKLNV
ncbi:ABC-ATPase domain-containing protein [Frisingicoccus caecimuris]|uniref:Putative ABC-class ATPase n=1 Tax=Frisingicoccus caecimuris TaxID=1796636 RepID=A0A4R2LCM1_9FIRM|nr:ABC-ATPase domain-containing protein [Frisingicoccus caecimuris]MCR1919072.1 ABC-ATPase domain-containing protein [Frisingicoccus caecimuris]TCO84850.1 putative ABC-class ATPase [Frisingicoccus caecimuris]